jgi:hypothetical protein
MGERIRGWTAAVLVFVLFCVAVGMMATLLVPDFSADMKRVFVAGPPLESQARGFTFIEDGYDGGAYDFAAGVRLAVLGLLAVGIPLGICAKVLATGKRRSAFDPQRGSVFQMGFLFQVGSLVLAAAILLLMSLDGLKSYTAAPFFSLMLAADVVIGAIAWRAWRSLQERRRDFVLHP